jgi:hypothetical protein
MLLKLPNIGLQRIIVGGASSNPDYLDAKGEVELGKGESILSPQQQKSLKHLLAQQKSKSFLRHQALVTDSTLRSRVSNSKSSLVAKNLFQNEILSQDHYTTEQEKMIQSKLKIMGNQTPPKFYQGFGLGTLLPQENPYS